MQCECEGGEGLSPFGGVGSNHRESFLAVWTPLLVLVGAVRLRKTSLSVTQSSKALARLFVLVS